MNRQKSERKLNVIQSLLIMTILQLVIVYLIFMTGCTPKRKVVILPDSRVIIDHPTREGYKCLETGYLYEIIKEFEQCQAK